MCNINWWMVDFYLSWTYRFHYYLLTLSLWWNFWTLNYPTSIYWHLMEPLGTFIPHVFHESFNGISHPWVCYLWMMLNASFLFWLTVVLFITKPAGDEFITIRKKITNTRKLFLVKNMWINPITVHFKWVNVLNFLTSS